MTTLASLPPELIGDILVYTDPTDVSAFSQISRLFHHLVYESSDHSIWRSLYVYQLELDDPRICLSAFGQPQTTDDVDWPNRVQDFVRARTFLRACDSDMPDKARIDALTTLIHLSTHTRPLAETQSNTLETIRKLLAGSAVFDLQPTSVQEDQLLSKLHVLYGLTSAESHSADARAEARAIVYNMHQYDSENHYGPFRPFSDRPDWKQLRAIHHVIARQVVDFGPTGLSIDDDEEDDEREGWEDLITFPLGMRKTQIPKAVLVSERDWAGIEGKWMVSFCFCDHEVLIDYNNSGINTLPGSPLDVSIFHNPNFLEVYRSIVITFSISAVSALRSPVTNMGKSMPILKITGTMDLPTPSVVEGQVRMTQDGHIRWSFVCGESNQPIWSCQGVQVGGVGCQFGVLGIWTTIFHADEDPVGPFWLRKMVDEDVDLE